MPIGMQGEGVTPTVVPAAAGKVGRGRGGTEETGIGVAAVLVGVA